MGFVTGGRYRITLALRQRLDVRARLADISGVAWSSRQAGAIGRGDHSRTGPDRDHLDRRRYRARLCVRPALQGLSLCRLDHGRSAVRRADAAQSAEGRNAPGRRGGICRTVRRSGGLYRVQRRIGQLAVAVDLRRLCPVRSYAVAGAGRANPRISRPIARPDSATLYSTIPSPAAISPPVSRTIDGRMTWSVAMISATMPNTELRTREVASNRVLQSSV